MSESDFICPNCKEKLEDFLNSEHTIVTKCVNDRCYINIVVIAFNE